MVRKRMAVMIFVAAVFFIGGLVPQSQALEAVVATKVVKKIDKIETLVRIADNVIILFDSSGSMGEPFGDSGMSKLAAATTILKQRANLLPATYPELKVGLYSYTPSNKGESKTVLYDLKPFNKAEFIKAVDELPKEASGPTLMVNAMRKLGKFLDTVHHLLHFLASPTPALSVAVCSFMLATGHVVTLGVGQRLGITASVVEFRVFLRSLLPPLRRVKGRVVVLHHSLPFSPWAARTSQTHEVIVFY